MLRHAAKVAAFGAVGVLSAVIAAAAAPVNVRVNGHLPPALRAVPNAPADTILYAFKGAEGAYPVGGLIDVKGTLYGTTTWGFLPGSNRHRSGVFHGNGGVFALVPSGNDYVETGEYGFGSGANDGSGPNATLIADKAGALYGTTFYGGAYAYGIVFKLTPSGSGFSETILHQFQGMPAKDGASPYAGLVADSKGVMYGTTEGGGASGQHCSKGCGTVYRLTPSRSTYVEDVIYKFAGGVDGHDPYGTLVIDKSGALYGTTYAGGTANKGTVFKLTPSGTGYTESVLHSFIAGADGADPIAGVLLAKNGTLFGTTFGGGGGKCAAGCGTVYALVPSGGTYTESVIYALQGKNDGNYPYAGLIAGKKGVLYGATLAGGGTGCANAGCGTIFALTPAGAGYTESIVYSFQGGSDGAQPKSVPLLKGSVFYGTAYAGGASTCFTDDPGCGAVYKLTL